MRRQATFTSSFPHALSSVLGESDAGGDTRGLRIRLDAGGAAAAGQNYRIVPDKGYAAGSLNPANGPLTLTNTNAGVTVSIQGPGANLLTISGGDAVQVFVINHGVTASISGLTVANGYGNVGGIQNLGTLTVSNSTFSGNSVVGGGRWQSTMPAEEPGDRVRFQRRKSMPVYKNTEFGPDKKCEDGWLRPQCAICLHVF